MPSVPVVRGPRVSPTPVRPINAPVEAFGGGVAATPIDVEPLAHLARNIFEQEKRKTDELVTLDAATKASALETALSLKIKQRKGRDAFSVQDDIDPEWQKGVEEIEKTLKNDTQKLAFARIKASHQRELNATMQTHVANERQQFDAEVANAYVKNETNAAITSGNPDRALLAIDNVQAAITDRLTRLYGADIPEGLLESAKLSAGSAIHMGLIQQLIADKRPTEAREYYDAHKTELAADHLTRATELTQEAVDDQQSFQAVDQVWTKLGPKSLNDAVKLADMEAAIREQYKAQPQVIESSIRELRSRVQAFEAQSAEVTRANTAAVWDAVDQGASMASVTRMPEYLALTGTQRVALKADIAQERDRRADVARQGGPGDPDKFLNLMNEAYFNPEKFAQTNIMTVPGLNTQQRASLMAQQRTVGNREVREDVSVLQRAVTRAEVDVRHYTRKVEQATKDADDESRALFQGRLDEAEAELREAAKSLEARKEAGVTGADLPIREPGRLPDGRRLPIPGMTDEAAIAAHRAQFQKTPPTPQMLEDVARKGPGYAAYLRSMGVDVPLTVPMTPAKK